jgi:hypothetical protein
MPNNPTRTVGLFDADDFAVLLEEVGYDHIDRLVRRWWGIIPAKARRTPEQREGACNKQIRAR